MLLEILLRRRRVGGDTLGWWRRPGAAALGRSVRDNVPWWRYHVQDVHGMDQFAAAGAHKLVFFEALAVVPVLTAKLEDVAGIVVLQFAGRRPQQIFGVEMAIGNHVNGWFVLERNLLGSNSTGAVRSTGRRGTICTGIKTVAAASAQGTSVLLLMSLRALGKSGGIRFDRDCVVPGDRAIPGRAIHKAQPMKIVASNAATSGSTYAVAGSLGVIR